MSQPWWIPRFLGRAPALPEPQMRMLGSVALALLFESYDQAMLTAALKQIAEGLEVAESDLGSLLGYIRLGAIPAFLLIPFGDAIGRRRMFLISVIGLSLATALSAFAQNVIQFAALQMASRTFMVTCSATAYVIVAEEFPKDHRGWGVGILGALAAFGHGLGLVLFAGIEYLPFGWRAMYVVGMVPLFLIPRFRRRVPETQRFQRFERQRSASVMEGWLHSLVALARTHPWRMLAVGLIGSLSSAGHGAAFNFSAYYVQEIHGWAPGQFTLMAIAGGLVGIIGHPYAGRVADHRGRRTVGFWLFAVYPALALGFYHGPGWALALLWIPLIFSLTGGNTISRALSTELFPTSHRGTASGWLLLVETLGAGGGFFLVSWGTAAGESNVPMISLVVFATLIAAGLVLMLPETSRRELEDISHGA